MKKLIELSVEGAKVLDLCIEGDKLIEQGTAGVYNKSVKGVKVAKGEFSSLVPFFRYSKLLPGIAFPTCVSVNNCVAHFSPLACVLHT